MPKLHRCRSYNKLQMISSLQPLSGNESQSFCLVLFFPIYLQLYILVHTVVNTTPQTYLANILNKLLLDPLLCVLQLGCIKRKHKTQTLILHYVVSQNYFLDTRPLFCSMNVTKEMLPYCNVHSARLQLLQQKTSLNPDWIITTG